MQKLIAVFTKDESGATTVDWVVLTAGVVALNVAVLVGFIESGISTAASSVLEELTTAING